MAITPTVFIGLGGTGYKVMNRLRRRLSSYYGNIEKYCPMFEFIFIDTNQETQEPNAVYANVANVKDYVENGEENGVSEWFPKEKYSAQAVSDGASQVRPFGRLAFFCNYAAIHGKLQNAINKVSAADSYEALTSSYKLRQKGLTDSVKIDNSGRIAVIAVASIAGGTGSGMIVDTLAEINQQLGDGASHDLFAYLLMPGCFTDTASGGIVGKNSLRANGYACLQELEYFQYPLAKVFTEAKWSGGDNKITSKLAERVYLFSGRSAVNKTLDRTEDIYDMLAENIFKDYTLEEFANAKRATLDNQKAALQRLFVTSYNVDDIQIKKEFSQSFQSQGYAAIGTSHDCLVDACAYTCIKELVQYWQYLQKPDYTTAEVPVPEELAFLPFYGSYCPDSSTVFSPDANPLFKALLSVPAKVDEEMSEKPEADCLEAFNRVFESGFNCLSQMLNTVPDVPLADNEGFTASVLKAVGDAEKALNPDNESENNFCKYIQTNLNNLKNYVKTKIDGWSQEQLRTAKVVQLASHLAALLNVLEENRKTAEEFSESLDALIEASKQKYQKAAANLATIRINGLIIKYDDERFILFKTALKAAFGSFEKIADAAKLQQVSAEGYLTAQLIKRVYGAYLNIIDYAAGIFKQLIHSYELTWQDLQIVGDFFDKMQKESIYCIPDSAFVSPLLSWNEKSIRSEIYEPSIAETDGGSKPLAEVKKEFFDNISAYYFSKINFADFKNTIYSLAAETRCNTDIFIPLIDYAGGLFRPRVSEKANFWKLFLNKYPDDPVKQSNAIEELCLRSAVWANKNTAIDAFSDSFAQPHILIGLPQLPAKPDEKILQLQQQIVGLLQSNLKLASLTDLPTGDELIISQTGEPFPLCSLSEVSELAEAYRKTPDIPRHITINDYIFDDITLLNRSELEKNIEISETVLLALEFDVIKFTRDKTYAYHNTKDEAGQLITLALYVDENNRERKINDIVEYLKTKPNILQNIREHLSERLNPIIENLPAAEDWSEGDPLPPPTKWEIACLLNMRRLERAVSPQNSTTLPFSYYIWQRLLQKAYQQILGVSFEDAKTVRASLINDAVNKLFDLQTESQNRFHYVQSVRVKEQAEKILSEDPGSFIIRKDDGVLMWFDAYPLYQPLTPFIAQPQQDPQNGYAPPPGYPQPQYAPPAGYAQPQYAPPVGYAQPQYAPPAGYAQPQYAPPPGYPQPQYGPPVGYAQPQYGPPAGYPQPQYGPPVGYAQPQYGPPAGYAQPQYGPPPGYAQPQYRAQAAYAQPQAPVPPPGYAQPQYGQPDKAEQNRLEAGEEKAADPAEDQEEE